jgi:prolyl 4-hydroxylase
MTPELRNWMVEQVHAGISTEFIRETLVNFGLSAQDAFELLNRTLDELEEEGVYAGLPPVVPVPEPVLADSPLFIDAGDRRVHVLQKLDRPRVVVFGSFMSDQECDDLIELAKPRMKMSLVIGATGETESNPVRTSSGMLFRRGENAVIARIEARIAQLVNWPEENGEGMQVMRYGPGEEYRPHHDYVDPNAPGAAAIIEQGGQRVATLLMYLGEPEKGGGTIFPDVGLEVAPKRGHLVFFSYDRPHGSTKTLHGGAPVIAGEKWIATKWLSERIE